MTKIKILVSLTVLGIAYFYYGFGRYKEGLTVQTNSGLVKGSMSMSRDGREFNQWLAVPYGEPPVGNLRFASPKPVKSWNGIRDASRYGSMCPQIEMAVHWNIGDEDCLHMNIYAPKLGEAEKKKDGLLPTMVYIHGGAFVMGAGKEYGAEYFMDEDVIFVTVNYRVGVMGFLSTGDKEIRGNMGLKDQAEALRWIKSNIEFFGGDPTKVTIFGESAGGASVHYLTLSSKTKGLFQKAISLSGTAILPWSFSPLKTIVRKTETLGENLNCPLTNSSVLTECLRSLPVGRLLDAYKKDVAEMTLINPSRSGKQFTPTHETFFNQEDDDTFITDKPMDILLQGRAHKIPWMSGVTQDEGLLASWEFYRDDKAMAEVEKNWDSHMKEMFSLTTTYSPPIATKTTKELREFYFGKGDDLSDEEKRKRFTQLYSDGLFLVGLSEAANIQREFAPVYLYYLDRHGGPTEFSDIMSQLKRNTEAGPLVEIFNFAVKFVWNKYILGTPSIDYGVGHAADLGYLFPLKGLVYLNKNDGDADYKFSKNLIRLLVSFAKDEKSMEFRSTKFFPTGTKGPLMYLNLNDSPKITPEPFEERSNFWRSLNYAKMFSNLK